MQIQRKLTLIYIGVIVILLTTILITISSLLYFQRIESAKNEAIQDAHELNGLMEINQPEINSTFQKKIADIYGEQTKRHIWVYDITGKNLITTHTEDKQTMENPEIKESISSTLGDQKVRNISLDISGIQRHFVIIPVDFQGNVDGCDFNGIRIRIYCGIDLSASYSICIHYGSIRFHFDTIYLCFYP